MAAASLTSNHINYLIWRYLQESGYGESAVKLQRNWMEDPQLLPFAPAIKTHALVTLVQKGLQYYEIEQSLAKASKSSRPVSSNESIFFFGANAGRSSVSPPSHGQAQGQGQSHGNVNESVAWGAETSSRKHARETEPPLPGHANATLPTASARTNATIDAIAQEPSPKRSRRSNGAENGHDESMEIDSEQPPFADHYLQQQQPHTTQAKANASANGQAQPSNVADRMVVETMPKTEPRDDQTAVSGPPPAFAEVSVSLPLALAPPPSRLVTKGASTGTQVDKITELSGETTFLDLLDDQTGPARGGVADQGGASAGGGAGGGGAVGAAASGASDGTPGSVMHCAWNPADPTSLFTAGTDALARIWNTSPNISRDHHGPPDRHQATHVDLNERTTDTCMVSANSWSPDGSMIAVGFCDPNHITRGQVSIWFKDGRLVNILPCGQDTVLCLRWNPAGTVLLGIGAGYETSTVVLWDPLTADSFDSVPIDAPLEDAVWVNESTFIVTGGQALRVYHFDGRCSLVHSYRVPENADLWMVKHDPVTGFIATCTHGTTVDLWDQRERIRTFEPHAAQITGLEWQPLPNPRSHHDDEPRLLATSSIDGSIRIWNGNRPWQFLRTLSLGRANYPVMAMAFSPDGFAIAGASFSKILVWSAAEGGLPKASWNGKMLEHDRYVNGDSAMNGVEGEGDEGDGEAEQHSLSWDADGGKLAYGLSQQIAIINFRK